MPSSLPLVTRRAYWAQALLDILEEPAHLTPSGKF
jgi:hypothetical protein